MSSYSEYLSRQQQRLQKFVDTRPHRDAGHQTEIVKRRAAAAVLETPVAVGSGNYTLNAPTTRKVNGSEFGYRLNYAGGHQVQDTSLFEAFEAGQAVAQSELPRNAKASQIREVCYSSSVVPEYNDRLAADPQLAAVQAARNAYLRGNCCTVCGKPPTLASGCNCSLTLAQRQALKDNVGPIQHTAVPNVRVT